MDLLFKRYASPFLFMDGMIQTGRFDDFVIEFVKTINEEKEEKTQWDFYLHKVVEGTFKDFKDEIEINRQNQQLSQRTIETTVNHSLDILNRFNPETQPEAQGGEQ